MTVRRAFTLIELIVVVAIIGILIALLLSAVQKVRESASRLACQNNVKQIALGLHHLAYSRGKLPPGYNDPENNSPYPSTGWTLSLLPYIEQQAIYDESIREFKRDPIFSGSGPSPNRHAGLSRFIKSYACPSDGRVQGTVTSVKHGFEVGTTSYLGSCGIRCTKPDGMLFPDSQVSLRDVSDGLSNTILVGERPPSSDFALGWWYAGIGQLNTGSAEMIIGTRERYFSSQYPCTPGVYEYTAGSLRNPCDAYHFWSPHSGGAWFGFGDGSVRFLSYSANPIMPALASRAGGESVTIPE